MRATSVDKPSNHLLLSPPLSSLPSILLAVSLVTMGLCSQHTHASQVSVKTVDSYRVLSQGTFRDAALFANGTLELGRVTSVVTSGLTGPVLDLVKHRGDMYVALAAPPRVMRIRAGKKAELIAKLDVGLVTSLVSTSRGLLATTAPDAGVVFIDTAKKKVALKIIVPDVKMVLDATVYRGDVYAVGGGDAGVLLRLPAGKKKFEVVLKTKEAHLRSIVADAKRKRLVIGGGDDGVLYVYAVGAKKDERFRALYDAAAEETTSITIDKRGRIFATFVDSNGKLSAGATSRDKDSTPSKKKKAKPRKVKSSEVIRVDPNGSVHILWQSKVDGAFCSALVDDGRRLIIGTGGTGKIFDIDPNGKFGAAVIARAEGFDEVTALLPSKRGLHMGTAHGGGVLLLENKKAKTGAFVTAPLSAKTLARWGRLNVDYHAPVGTIVKVSMRTGNTNIPDQTWTAYSPALLHAGTPLVAPGRYAQVRIEMVGDGKLSPTVRTIRAAYLEDNRPPELDRIDMIRANIRVKASPKEKKNGNRSVTFGKNAFKKFKYGGGSPLKKLGDRTSGKQTNEQGWRTVFAWAEDPDKDLLRFRWSLGAVDGRGNVAKFDVVKEWSDEPFLSIDTERLKEGTYRARVEVSDLPSNGPDRALADTMDSANIVATRAAPVISGGRARELKSERVRVRFNVKAQVPLILARCSVGGGDWVPIDSLDGMVDSDEERFETILEGRANFGSVACEVTDELGHTTRQALEVR